VSMQIFYLLVLILFGHFEACGSSFNYQEAAESLHLQIEPYKLPDNHPAKLNLDIIFAKANVLTSENTMREAGFYTPQPRPRGLIISGHPMLQGYLIKAYLDTKPICEWKEWIQRVKGAHSIQNALDKFRSNDQLKVPKKWIYTLPAVNSIAHKGKLCPKLTILIVEDMELLSDKDNLSHFSDIITPQHLTALFQVIIECRLGDSHNPFNIPFSKDHKIAFVDTERTGIENFSLKYLRFLGNYLSPDMKEFWNGLTQSVVFP
jgi:hypothetical protein